MFYALSCIGQIITQVIRVARQLCLFQPPNHQPPNTNHEQRTTLIENYFLALSANFVAYISEALKI